MKLNNEQKRLLDGVMERHIIEDLADLTNKEIDEIVSCNDYDDVLLDINDYILNRDLYNEAIEIKPNEDIK